MRGIVFDFEAPCSDLTEVTFTKTTFDCKYHQGGYVYRIETRSRDGITYKGNFGWPEFEDGYTLELKRFESKDKEIVLLGTWHHPDKNEGAYLFRLYPPDTAGG